MKEIDFMPHRQAIDRRRRRYGRRGVLLLGASALLVLAVHVAGLLRPHGAAATFRQALAIDAAEDNAIPEAPARPAASSRPAATGTDGRMPTE